MVDFQAICLLLPHQGLAGFPLKAELFPSVSPGDSGSAMSSGPDMLLQNPWFPHVRAGYIHPVPPKPVFQPRTSQGERGDMAGLSAPRTSGRPTGALTQ